MDLEVERDKLFEANQTRLPVEDRAAEAGPTCSARAEGWTCTKGPHTSGDHVAHGRLGLVVKRW